MELYYYILWGIFGIVGQVLQAYSLAAMLKIEKQKRFKVVFIGITGTFGILRLLIMYFELQEWQWIITGNIIAVILITTLMATDRFWKKVLAISIVIVGTILSEVAAEWTYPLPKPENMPLAKGAELYDLWLLVHLVVLLRCAIFIWKKYFSGEHFSKNVPMIMIPLLVNLYLSIAGCYSHFGMDYWDNVYYDTLLLPMMIPVISIFFVLLHQNRKEQAEEELEEMEHKLALERMHYRSIEENREEMARFRHDFNNRLLTAKHLLETGEAEEGRKMIMMLERKIEKE